VSHVSYQRPPRCPTSIQQLGGPSCNAFNEIGANRKRSDPEELKVRLLNLGEGGGQKGRQPCAAYQFHPVRIASADFPATPASATGPHHRCHTHCATDSTAPRRTKDDTEGQSFFLSGMARWYTSADSWICERIKSTNRTIAISRDSFSFFCFRISILDVVYVTYKNIILDVII
jgi:hypothetical protein